MVGRMVLFFCCFLCGLATPATADVDTAQGRSVLGRPGYLIMTDVRDSLADYAWREGTEPGTRSLVWPGGVLTIPLTLTPEEFLDTDLGFPLEASFGGTASSGNLSLADGRYQVSEPVMLSDGVVRMYVSSGELEIRGERLRYSPAVIDNSDPRANFLLLAGIMLLILVLMRRARRILKRNR